MTEWRKVKLGDCCEITSSKRIFYNEYVESGVPFYRSKEIIEKAKGDTISTPLFISHARFKEIQESFGAPQKRDLLLTAVGSLGIPYLINDSNPFYFKDGNLIWFKSFNGDLNSEFLYYWFKTRSAFQMLDKIAIGSAQKALTISSIKQISIEIPARDIQDRIVTVLSRYDALIENYQRQIKLLEEAAQRLYKEWFVDLRFPGHQSTPIINNLPEGWEKKKLGEIARLKAGGDKPKVFSSEKTFELTIPVYSNGTINEGLYGYTDTAEINVPCVTISARGSVGYTVLRRTPFVPIVRLISVIPDDIYVGYLFFYIKDMPLDSNGAAQQQITVPMMKDKEIIIPENGVLNGFRSQVEPFFITVDCLKRSIRNLSEARERLLPKLMSAEIEV